MAAPSNFYDRLTRLVRSGPTVMRRRLRQKGQDPKNYYDQSILKTPLGYGAGMMGFRRNDSPFASFVGYGALDRQARYGEFAEMEYTPEISTALDVYSHETCSGDEQGKCFHIKSNNPEVQKALETLFYEIYNINFEGPRDVRNLLKNGDFFRYVEVIPGEGVTLVEPLHVNEVERQENYDPADPLAVRYQLLSRGGKILQPWQILHFRLLSNDAFIPYGTSILESIRRVWRQLVMMEDAMLVYRVVRSPERRVFYIDTSAIKPEDHGNYLEAVKETLRGQSVMDRQNGRQDLRMNPVSVNDDYFIPTRPNSNTKIETLAGGQHVSATEDVEYLRSKVIAGLKVPKAYLTFDESLSSKATLAQEDIRFSRTISIIQKIMVAELRNLAIYHLLALGFEGEDLLSFELHFSNPSTVATQQKLALLSSRLDIASKAWELAKDTSICDLLYIQKEVLGFTDEQIARMKGGAIDDQKRIAFLTAARELKPKEDDNKSVTDPFDPATNYNVPGSGAGAANQQSPQAPAYSPSGVRGKPVMLAEPTQVPPAPLGKLPVQPNPRVAQLQRQSNRSQQYRGIAATVMPDFAKMLDPNNRYAQDPYDMEEIFRLTEGRIEEWDQEMRRGSRGLPTRGIDSSLRRNLKMLKEHLDSSVLTLEFEDDEALSESSVPAEWRNLLSQ